MMIIDKDLERLRQTNDNFHRHWEGQEKQSEISKTERAKIIAKSRKTMT